jgi:hypothetical protein
MKLLASAVRKCVFGMCYEALLCDLQGPSGWQQRTVANNTKRKLAWKTLMSMRTDTKTDMYADTYRHVQMKEQTRGEATYTRR